MTRSHTRQGNRLPRHGKTAGRRKPLFERLEGRRVLDGAGLANGMFDVADPTDADFGWDTLGDVEVVAGEAVLAEAQADITELVQSFPISAGSTSLRLTVESLDLHSNVANPPDAFEVALLHAVTGAPVTGTAAGLPGTDAWLNLNGQDRVFFGSGVTVPGAGASGDVASLAFPLEVTLDVSGVAAGTQVSLYVDLLGWSDVDSRVVVDDVRLIGSLPPTLSVAIDPATDSGNVGDRYTNFSVIHLVGSTDPGQEVHLDLDGDGYDDGVTTADAGGNFRFQDIVPIDGTQVIRVRAENTHGTSERSRDVTLDQQPATSELVVPAPGSVVEEDPGYVEVVWTDAGLAGVDPDSYDPADVLIPGVSIDRAEHLGGGHVRYWYSDDGEALPWGHNTVMRKAGGVVDRAGNGNAAVTDEFARLRAVCAWQNPDLHEDVDLDGHIVPLDALVIINRLNSKGSGGLPVPATLPDVPPPFVDTNCDQFNSPLDALIVINWLNLRAGGEGEGAASTAQMGTRADSVRLDGGAGEGDPGDTRSSVPLVSFSSLAESPLQSWHDGGQTGDDEERELDRVARIDAVFSDDAAGDLLESPL